MPEYRLFYRALLQKRMIILRRLLIVATPYWYRVAKMHRMSRRIACRRRMSCLLVQGGENTSDAFGCRSFSAKEPLIRGLFCGKRSVKTRHSLRLCNPVLKAQNFRTKMIQKQLHGLDALIDEQVQICQKRRM